MKNKVKLGICAVVKDTADYVFKEWVNYHFNMGVSKIIVYVDCGSKPIYQDDRVEYVYLDTESKQVCIENGNKYCFEPDCGSNFQVGLYNIVLEQHREDLDWLACIDDDEFLVLNLDDLNKYKNESCLLLPWKMMFTSDIKCKYSLDNYSEFPPYYLHVYSNRYTKALLNCKTCWKDRDLHHGDYAGIIMDFENITPEYHKNSLYITNNNVIFDIFYNAKNYIRHYKVRSFEEWVESIVDRKYNVYDIYDYDKRTWNREIKQYFSSNPYFFALNTKYDKDVLDDMLKRIDRDDVKKTPYYDFAKIPVNKKLTGTYEVIYNSNGNGQIPLEKMKSLIKSGKKYIIIDYTYNSVFDFLNDYENIEYEVKSKNEFMLWMRLLNKQKNKPRTELVCVTDLLKEMYPKIKINMNFIK